MFTGIVEELGLVKSWGKAETVPRLFIFAPKIASETYPGQSICVNGVCLTAVEIKRDLIAFEIMQETFKRTNLGLLKDKDKVNLERALRLGDRIGGHLVSGHIDGIGVVLSSEPSQRSQRIRVGIDKEIARYTIEKGSIAVDGISLTINHCDHASFEVNIIPQTSQETTILGKRVGDKVNIETDLIGKYVERLLMARKNGDEVHKDSAIDYDMLKKHGFGR